MILRNNIDLMAISKSEIGMVSIIGASGYGGLQLVKLINDHPNFEISNLCGKKPQCDKCPIRKDCSYQYLEEKKAKNNKDFKEKKLYMLYVKQKNRSKKVLMYKNKKSNIWKNLFLFPTFNKLSDLKNFIKEELKLDYNNKSRVTISHRLSHIKMNISFYEVCVKETNYLQYQWLSYKKDMAVPKPVQDFLNKQYREMK